jgi:predicted secreted protein
MSDAFAGLETVMEIGYGSAASVFKVVGRCTAKAISSTLDNIDATSDDSPGKIREYVETYIGQTVNFAANAGTDIARSATVDELELFLYDPSTQTQTDRTLTIRLTRPVSAAVATNRAYVMDILPSSWNIDAPSDGLVTVTIDANTTSAVAITDTAV